MKGQLGNIAFSLLSDSLGELMLLVRVTQLISKHGSKQQQSSSLEMSAAPPLGVSGRPYRQQGLEQPGRMNWAWDWNGCTKSHIQMYNKSYKNVQGGAMVSNEKRIG